MNSVSVKDKNDWRCTSIGEVNYRSCPLDELTLSEVEKVSGGFSVMDGFNWGLALGTVGGAVWTGSSIGATRYGIIGGALGFSAGLGWGLGSVISMALRGE
ncbi:MAG: hypothetical protein AAF098_18220 [Pseudomonadota bacterium]